jgi:hypothetical protein
VSETVLESLLKRRAELQKELSQLESLISFYEMQESKKSILNTSINSQGHNSAFRNAVHLKAKNRGLPAKVAEEIFNILSLRQSPMTRGAIARALMKKGIAIPQTDPAKYGGTILWRNSDIFENIEGEGYSIRKKRSR